MNQVTVKTLTGIKNAILKHKKVWLTMNGKTWLYVELRKDSSVFINRGLNADTLPFKSAMVNILNFLS